MLVLNGLNIYYIWLDERGDVTVDDSAGGTLTRMSVGSGVFIRGDANADGEVDISDPIFLLAYLYTGGPATTCWDAADGNDDGETDLSDAVYVLSYLYVGNSPPPPPPFPEPGRDETEDELVCPE